MDDDKKNLIDHNEDIDKIIENEIKDDDYQYDEKGYVPEDKSANKKT
ncbi:MAG: hypothetical protein GF365_03835 [Candidatus Buchananbacteria bacterium]|nr:hypothetical protein [Candidatus Buchananbacteria bacterium]